MNSKRRASFCVALGKVMHNKKPLLIFWDFFMDAAKSPYILGLMTLFCFDHEMTYRKWLRIQGLASIFLKNLGGVVLNSFQSSLVDEKLNLFSTHAKIRTQDADVEEGETKTIRINENLRSLLLAAGPKWWVWERIHIFKF